MMYLCVNQAVSVDKPRKIRYICDETIHRKETTKCEARYLHLTCNYCSKNGVTVNNKKI